MSRSPEWAPFAPALTAPRARELRLAPGGRRLARRAGSAALGLHGAVHVAGFVILLEGAAPATLALDDAWPEPGSGGATAIAVVWLLAAVAFLLSAYCVRAHLRWRLATALATLLSLAVAVPMLLASPGTVVAAGVAVDLALWAWLAYAWLSRPHPRW